MRALCFVTMLVLAVISVAEGNLPLALVFGGAKALLIGVGYMELSKSARVHMLGFILFVVAVTGTLVLVAGAPMDRGSNTASSWRARVEITS